MSQTIVQVVLDSYENVSAQVSLEPNEQGSLETIATEGYVTSAIANALDPEAFGLIMYNWLMTLPTAPQATPGWWRNGGTSLIGGTPTYS